MILPRLTHTEWIILEYVRIGMKTKHDSSLRDGQILYNSLNLIRPDIAAKIDQTDLDPFYTKDLLKIADLLALIKPE